MFCFVSEKISKPESLKLQILSVCLLYEMCKGKSSFWYPYLVHLPRDYDLLATFGEFEKQALQVLYLLHYAFVFNFWFWNRSIEIMSLSFLCSGDVNSKNWKFCDHVLRLKMLFGLQRKL